VVWTGRLGDGEVYVPAWMKLTGQTQEESRRDWTVAVHPEDRTEVVEAWSRFIQQGNIVGSP
jgi:hypothetical protein